MITTKLIPYGHPGGIPISCTLEEGRVSQRILDDIVINHEPDYLIALYMNKNGNIYEVYNGPGKLPWESASKKDSHNNRHMRANKLMELDKDVVEAIAGENMVDLIDATKEKEGDMSGYDTFGPFKLVGGIAKGHPDDKDLADAVAFYKGILQNM